MDTTASSFTARNNAKRAAEKMIANGKAPAVDYGIRPRDDGRFEIVWKTAPTIGEVEASTNPRLSVNEDPSYAPPNAGAEEAAATGNEPAASSVPVFGAPERDNKWPDGTRVMVCNKPQSWSEATPDWSALTGKALVPIKIPAAMANALFVGTILNRGISLNNRPRSNLVRQLSRQELAVIEVGGEGAAFDDDLAAQHGERWPGGEVAAFPGAVIGFVQFGGAHGLATARVEHDDIGVRADRQRPFARI